MEKEKLIASSNTNELTPTPVELPGMKHHKTSHPCKRGENGLTAWDDHAVRRGEKTPGCFSASPDEAQPGVLTQTAQPSVLGRPTLGSPTRKAPSPHPEGIPAPCSPLPALTWVILARSSDGRCSCASWGLRRLTPTFLSLRTQGCERLRHSPVARRLSCGVEAGVLLAEGGPGSEEEKRS